MRKILILILLAIGLSGQAQDICVVGHDACIFREGVSWVTVIDEIEYKRSTFSQALDVFYLSTLKYKRNFSLGNRGIVWLTCRYNMAQGYFEIRYDEHGEVYHFQTWQDVQVTIEEVLSEAVRNRILYID